MVDTYLGSAEGTAHVYSKISPGSSKVCGTIAAVAMAPEIVTNAIIAALSAGAV